LNKDIKENYFKSKPIPDIVLISLDLAVFKLILSLLGKSFPQDIVPVLGQVDLEIRDVVVKVKLVHRVN
jgi:hypothetical protein